MTVKDCGHDDDDSRKLNRKIIVWVLSFVILVLFVVFLIWLILRPTKPQFILIDATIFAFNITGTGSPPFSLANSLTSNFQITISCRNPNARIGIFYDKLDVHASYHGQQITLPTLLPPSYQGHKDVTVWSPFIYGSSVPVAPYLGESLGQDQVAGTVLIDIRVDGRVRWKVGTFVSGRYRLYANCPAFISFGAGRNGGNGFLSGPSIKYQLAQSCHVDV